jgi:trimeric autotransporter adhesin
LLNPAAIGAPAAGQWGNAGRDSMRGPFQFSINGQMQRAFRIRDRFNLQLNITANNPLNHPIITSVYTTLNPQFGLPSAVGAMRSVATYLRLTF